MCPHPIPSSGGRSGGTCKRTKVCKHSPSLRLFCDQKGWGRQRDGSPLKPAHKLGSLRGFQRRGTPVLRVMVTEWDGTWHPKGGRDWHPKDKRHWYPKNGGHPRNGRSPSQRMEGLQCPNNRRSLSQSMEGLWCPRNGKTPLQRMEGLRCPKNRRSPIPKDGRALVPQE